MLARTGMELFMNQLLDRGNSSVVMRYVGQAALDSITSDAIRLMAKHSVDDEIGGLKRDVRELMASAALGPGFESLKEEVEQLKAQAAKQPQEAAPQTCNVDIDRPS